MKLKKVKFNDVFYIIHEESFYYTLPESIKKEALEDSKLITYKWVIPVYVKSINNNFDGVESFDLCPVDISTIKDHKSGWKWSRNFEYEDIGKEIFYTKEEAFNVYNKKYSDESKKVYEEFRRLRFIQEKDSSLI